MPDSATTTRSGGHQRAQADRQLAVERERAQVAVVDADDRRAQRQRAVELGAIVHLDQRVDAGLARGGEQRA